jgi:hypothetical protein
MVQPTASLFQTAWSRQYIHSGSCPRCEKIGKHVNLTHYFKNEPLRDHIQYRCVLGSVLYSIAKSLKLSSVLHLTSIRLLSGFLTHENQS